MRELCSPSRQPHHLSSPRALKPIKHFVRSSSFTPLPLVRSDIVPPKSLVMGDLTLLLVPGGEPSQIMNAQHLRAVASSLPPMQRFLSWQLAYSTARHGISLGTLFRRSAGHTPTLLVIRDTAGFVFGCYSEDGWRSSPRFYGTGETFVFQLEPHRIMYPWRPLSQVKNDFFQVCPGEVHCIVSLFSSHCFPPWLTVCDARQPRCGRAGPFCHSSGRGAAAGLQQHLRNIWQPVPGQQRRVQGVRAGSLASCAKLDQPFLPPARLYIAVKCHCIRSYQTNSVTFPLLFCFNG